MNFEGYFQHTALQTEIANHTEKAKEGLERLLSNFYEESIRNQLFSLDTIHKTLKHLRSCPDLDDDEQQQCVDESILEAINKVIFERLTAVETFEMSEYTMAVCICLLDLLKQDLVWDYDHLRLTVTTTKRLLMSPSSNIYVYRKALLINKKLMKADIDDDMLKEIVNTTCSFVQVCRQRITQQDIERMANEEYTEFFYTPFEHFTCDRECLKLVTQTIIDIFGYLTRTNQEDLVEKESYWIDLIHNIKDLQQRNKHNFVKFLFDTCCVGDDDTVQLLNAILEIYQLFSVNSKKSTIKALLESIEMNPHSLFLRFLYQCGNTHSIVVDLLLENDSNFLVFFYNYIKYALVDTQRLKDNLNNVQGINVDTLCIIITNTLRVIKGDAFPYNVKPLVKRLEQLLLVLK